jgi:hypothetical protein
MSSSNKLKDRIGRGEFNFERFVEILSSRGYITEHEDEVSFGSSAMEYFQQEEFDTLLQFFFPNRLNNIELKCASTDRGGQKNAYSYALYNENVVSRDEVFKVLEKINRARNR